MSAVCASCNEALVVVISPSDDEDEDGTDSMDTDKTVPDDCQLRCACHFHWQCLLDAYEVTKCPACSQEIVTYGPSGEQQVLCNLENEGGRQVDVDIFSELVEEQYLRAFPNERKARAFLQFCLEGNLDAVVGVLKSSDGDDDDDELQDDRGRAAPIDILRYQDPMGDGFSALHSAVAGKSQEVAWLLILLASELDLKAFPAEVFQEAEVLGLMRSDATGKLDIRSMRDANGRSAEDLAVEIGHPWKSWIGKQRLTI